MDTKQELAWLKKNGTKRTREGMARYGIVAGRAFGVTMGQLITLMNSK